MVRALVRAATASNPRSQYIVGGDAKFLLLPLLNLPTPFVEDLMHAVLYTRLVPACLRDGPQQGQQGQGQLSQAAAPKAATAAMAAAGSKEEGKAEEKTPVAG